MLLFYILDCLVRKLMGDFFRTFLNFFSSTFTIPYIPYLIHTQHVTQLICTFARTAGGAIFFLIFVTPNNMMIIITGTMSTRWLTPTSTLIGEDVMIIFDLINTQLIGFGILLLIWVYVWHLIILRFNYNFLKFDHVRPILSPSISH